MKVQAEDHNELNQLWAEMQRVDLAEGTLDEYLAVDVQLATGGARTLAEIAVDVSTMEMEEAEVDRHVFFVCFLIILPFSDTDVMKIDEVAELPVTSGEATVGFKVFQRYVEENSDDPAVLQMCYKFDDFLAKQRLKKLKQKSLLEYFTPTI